MRKHFLLAALLLLQLAVVSAQPAKVEFTKYELPNGLKVILHEDHSAPIVAVTVNYHVGSKNEKDNRTGFAHFFEHLLFEGSENVDRGEFDKYILGAGGSNNAYTTQDQTFYYEVLPSNQLALGLWLESERMLHAKVIQKSIDVQREVVKEERRQRVDNQPYGSFQEEILKNAYQTHPYRWAPIGSMADLDAATEQDYVDFYKTFYVPNNAILTIAGDFDTEEAKKMIAQYFATIPKGKVSIPRPSIKEKPLTKEVTATVYDNIQLPAVIMAYRVPERKSKDYYALQMLNTLMADGQSSRLYRALVDEQQLALAAGTFPFDLEDPGLSIAYAIANVGVKPDQLTQAINAEFEKVRKSGVPEKEFAKLRNQIETNLVTSNASVLGIATRLSDAEMFMGGAETVNQEMQRYQQVTAADIQRVAQQYFRPTNRVRLTYLPKPAQP